MKVNIYIVKAKSQAGNIQVKDIMTTQKKPKQNKNQLGILKSYAFCWNVQQKTLVPEEITATVTYLCMRIHLKSCPIFPIKVATTLLKSAVRA